jgi:hypothetical protein
MATKKGAETVKVIVRCRPISELETSQGHERFLIFLLHLRFDCGKENNYFTFRIVDMFTDRGVIELKNPKEPGEPPKSFTFDAIYDWK